MCWKLQPGTTTMVATTKDKGCMQAEGADTTNSLVCPAHQEKDQQGTERHKKEL